MQTRKASQASEKKAEKGSRKTEEGSIRRKATPHKAKAERQKKDEEDGGSVPTSESEAEATDGDKALEEEEEEEESRVATTTESEESTSDIAAVDHKDNGLPVPTQPDEITIVKQQIERVTTERITVVEKEVESKPTKEEIDATQANLKEQEVLSSYTSTTPVNSKEQELLRSYEQLWEAENRLREVFKHSLTLVSASFNLFIIRKSTSKNVEGGSRLAEELIMSMRNVWQNCMHNRQPLQRKHLSLSSPH